MSEDHSKFASRIPASELMRLFAYEPSTGKIWEIKVGKRWAWLDREAA